MTVPENQFPLCTHSFPKLTLRGEAGGRDHRPRRHFNQYSRPAEPALPECENARGGLDFGRWEMRRMGVNGGAGVREGGWPAAVERGCGSSGRRRGGTRRRRRRGTPPRDTPPPAARTLEYTKRTPLQYILGDIFYITQELLQKLLSK